MNPTTALAKITLHQMHVLRIQTSILSGFYKTQQVVVELTEEQKSFYSRLAGLEDSSQKEGWDDGIYWDNGKPLQRVLTPDELLAHQMESLQQHIELANETLANME